jgi:hypothetical protein
LQGNLGGKLWIETELQEATGLLSYLSVLRKIASRLSHHPYGGWRTFATCQNVDERLRGHEVISRFFSLKD